MTSRDVIAGCARARHCADVTDDDDVERDAKFCVYPGPCRGVQDHVRDARVISSSSTRVVLVRGAARSPDRDRSARQ